MKNMKKIIFYILIALSVGSCAIDNYDEPTASLQGILADANGSGLQIEPGASSTRIKMEEVSWSSTPIPFYLNFKMDGTYINSKIFVARYAMTPVEGPFYPVIADTLEVNGNTTHNFKVTPYLNVSWVGTPIVEADKKITAKFKFTRNASPVAGVATPNLLDYQLFISTTKFVGNNNADLNMVASAVAATNLMENQELSITTKIAVKYSTTYYVRVGVRVSDSFKKYNYTDVKTVVIP
jgi:hypothetical protein